jgi:Zn-dependent protease
MFAELTIHLIVFRFLSLLVMAAVQGVTVAATTVALGDPGPRYDARLTGNPLRHLDLFGSLSTIFSAIGWSSPVAVDPAEFRIGRAGVVVVILAPFVALVGTAFVLHLLVIPALTILPYTAGITTAAFLRVAARIGLWFALLGLIPIPPLAGGLLLNAFGIRVPRQAQWILAVVLLAAVATGVVRQLLGPGHAVLASVILGE